MSKLVRISSPAPGVSHRAYPAKLGPGRVLATGRAFIIATALGAAVVCAPVSDASARSAGVLDFNCVGCHGVSDVPIELAFQPATFQPGETVTVELKASGATGVSFGFYLGVSNGEFVTPSGARGTATELTHTTPLDFDDTGSFFVQWTTPDEPGLTRFDIGVVVANGNGTRDGDRADEVTIERVFGCPPQTFFRDLDNDGFGHPTVTVLACAGPAPAGASLNNEDCDDFDQQRFPGATERCNREDDDCDGEVDEDSELVLLFPDADNDGYYGVDEGMSSAPILGCIEPGFAALSGDCAPDDPNRNPGAEEVCNAVDDDCDAFVDERVRPVCGVGWCRRQASDCEGLICTPGEPTEELCNGIDDDCDGLTDESGCPAGLTCIDTECVSDGTAPEDNPPDDEESAPAPSGCTTAPPSFLVLLLRARRRRNI
ncbi:MAG: putative metal-binding motif-containing protein [Myxococcota bacterium]